MVAWLRWVAKRGGEIPLYATRRTNTVRKKKPGRFVRNDVSGYGLRHG
jgi:hypothetical protein